MYQVKVTYKRTVAWLIDPIMWTERDQSKGRKFLTKLDAQKMADEARESCDWPDSVKFTVVPAK